MRYAHIKQHDASDCAAAVVATILLTYKKESSIAKIRDVIRTTRYGTDVRMIVEGLVSFGFDARAVRFELSGLTQDLTYPAILHIDGDHYVVVHKVTEKYMWIADPKNEKVKKVKRETYEPKCTGVAVFLAPVSAIIASKAENHTIIDHAAQIIKPHIKELLFIVFMSMILVVLGIFGSLFSKIIMDEIIPYHLKDQLVVLVCVFGFACVMQHILSACRAHAVLYVSRRIDIPMMLGYFQKILDLPLSFFESRNIGDVLTRVQDAMQIRDIVTQISVSVLIDILLPLSVGFFLYKISTLLFLSVILSLVAHGLTVLMFKKPYAKQSRRSMVLTSNLNTHIIDTLRNMSCIKSYNAQNRQLDVLERHYGEGSHASVSLGKLQNGHQFVSNVLGTVFQFSFLILGSLQIMEGTMTLGDFLVFQTLSQYFFEPIQNLMDLQLKIQEADLSMKRMKDLVEIDSETNIGTLNFENGDIVLENIMFAYDGIHPVLQNMNLTIERNQHIGIMGHSGCGKSTLAQCIAGHYVPTSGNILINDTHINHFKRLSLRQHCIYVSQNNDVTFGSILDNIQMGNDDITIETITRLSKRIGLHEAINRMPKGYHTILEEGGSNLSGGQRQRLTILRALVRTADVYIFDEISAHLDSESEAIILDAIYDVLHDKTVITISHRLHTLQYCDTIVVMDKGSLKHRGTYKELIKQRSEINAEIGFK